MRELWPGYHRSPPRSAAGSDPLHRLQVSASLLNHGSWAHLAHRFRESFGAPALNAEEVAWVERWLRPTEIAFFAQPAADQRHGLESAQATERLLPGEIVWIRAALLHDLGKRRSRLGTWGRSIVTGLAKIGLRGLFGRPNGRADLYLRHHEVGAVELAALGAEPEVVAFARHHHGDRPGSIPTEVWQVLLRVDR